jgi:hypothetical protein
MTESPDPQHPLVAENESFLEKAERAFRDLFARGPDTSFTSPSLSIQSFAANRMAVGRRPMMRI